MRANSTHNLGHLQPQPAHNPTGNENTDGNPTRPFVEGGNDGVAAPPARDEAERRDEGNDEALGVGLPALRNGPAAEAAEAAAGDGAAAGAAGQGGDAAERPRAEGWAGARRRDVGPGQDRRGVLGVLDKVERMLAGALEQLAAPPREEDLDGEVGASIAGIGVACPPVSSSC